MTFDRYKHPAIKKSPISIVKYFIVVEFLAAGVYAFAGSLAHYAQIYRNLPFTNPASFELAKSFFLFFTEVTLGLIIFFQWYKEYFQIRPDGLVWGMGLIFRKKIVIPYEHMVSISVHQGPLGKIVKYGAVKIRDGALGKTLVLRDIPEPHEFVRELSDFKRQSAAHTAIVADYSDILSQDEHERLEFKSTLRWDMNGNRVSKDIERAAIKTIAAFMNSRGGNLVIGVDDEKNVIGISADYKTLRKGDADGFENHFSNIFKTMIGPEFRRYVNVSFARRGGKDYCVLSVLPSQSPAYFKDEKREEFFIRTGNGTTALKLSAVNSYIESRFKNHPDLI